ncbi:MAG: aspartyl protease family protein [Saprospiraceae bacterium]|jgi:hypothetical protein
MKKPFDLQKVRLPGFPLPFKVFCLGVLLFWGAPGVNGQEYGFPGFLPVNNRQIDVPFEYENNFIVIKVLFNDVFPLRFIFDTGAEYTILSKREITDLLNIDYKKRFVLQGADMTTELYAYLARGISITVGNLRNANRNILVLEEDYFRFEEFSGIQIHGILGADMFRRFVVRINYQKQVISLILPDAFDPPKGSRSFNYPMEMQRGKPYIVAQTRLASDTVIQTKLLLDTGASLALLLYTNTHPDLHLPEKTIPSNIGIGLGGFLEGYLGRIRQLHIHNVPFDDVITNFQELPPEMDSLNTSGRHGIIGNQLLRRFIVTIDYIREQLYFTIVPGFRNSYTYDRSGLILIVAGPTLNKYVVFDIVPNSPAARVGIRRGDEVKSVNGIPVAFLTLQDLSAKFRRRAGAKMNLVIERSNVRLKKSFRLEQLI